MTRGDPRELYERTYVLLPPDADVALAAKVMGLVWDRERWTVGGSADDAGIGDLDVRRVIAISPGSWPGDLAVFFENHYPGVVYWPLDYSNDYQLEGRLLAYSLKESGFSLAYPTTHLPARVTQEFGVPIDAGHHCGLDLRSSWSAWGDEILSATDGIVTAAGYYNNAGGFGHRIRVQSQAPDGRAVHVRYAHLVEGGIYVKVGDEVVTGQKIGQPDSTGTSTADHLHLDVKAGGEYADPALLLEWPAEQPEQRLRAGFNDPLAQGAGEWMAAEGIEGVLCVPLFIGLTPRRVHLPANAPKELRAQLEESGQAALDFSSIADAGIRVIVNLRHSYAHRDGGSGTLPHSSDDGRFVDAVLGTMDNAKGVWGWTLCNEHNVPDEWHDADDPITPARYAAVYNSVWDDAGIGNLDVRLAPGAIDPFNAQYMDCREYWRQMWAGIRGADFVAVHGYVRGPNPDLCWSDEKFINDPLTWQYLNYWRCCQTLLEALPDQYARLPVVVTEFNHLWRDGGEGDWGWVDDERAGQVVEAAGQRAREWNERGSNPIMGLCLYRWRGDAWEAYDNPHVLAAVKDASSR